MDSNMDIKKNFLLSIIYFFGGLLALIGLDYLIRYSSDNFYQLGLNETIWFLSHILIAALVLFLFLKRAKHINLKSKMLFTAVLSFVGFIIYIVLVFGYVVGSGIDSL